jgi:hypothetical protein
MKTYSHADSFVVCDGAMSRELGDETVILSLDTGNYFGLNPVGTEVWRRLRNDQTLGQLLAELAAGFDVAPETLERDVRRLLDDLCARGLVQVRES